MRASGHGPAAVFKRMMGGEPKQGMGVDARRGPAPWAIAVAVAAGLGAIALIAFSLTRPEPPGRSPTAVAQPFDGGDDGSLVFTADASAESRWVFFSFDRGALVDGGTGDHWDLAFRRFHIIANGGPGFAGRAAIADLGDVAFEDAVVPPPDAFVETNAARDSTNAAIDRWYRYGFTSHLLTPLDRTYVVRSATNRHYALRVLGYYCPRARPGCISVRYKALTDPHPYPQPDGEPLPSRPRAT